MLLPTFSSRFRRALLFSALFTSLILRATTATSLSSFGGEEEPAVIYFPDTHTFVSDSYVNITDLGGGVFQMLLRYSPTQWDGDRTTSNTDRGRAEIKTLGAHQFIHDTFEYATTWRTNPEFVGSGAFCHITQLKPVDGVEGSSGSPLITTSIFSGTSSAAVRYASSSFSPANVFSPIVVRNITWAPATWLAETIRVRTTADGENTGQVVVSLNGDSFQGVTNVEVCRPSSTEYYPKWGLYRGTSVTSGFSPNDYIQHSNVSATLTSVTQDPAFSPAAGSYSAAQTVTITSGTSGASIRYTTDGSTPSETAGTLYSGPVTISTSATLKAIAYSSSLPDSNVTSATYTIGSTIISFEAESLGRTSTGAGTSVQTDVNTSGGKWISLDANGAGQYVEYTLPNIPAGVYSLQMSYKTNNNRGMLQLAIDGTDLGDVLDQYKPTPSIYPTQTFGVVTFTSASDHIVRLTVTGKNSASKGFGLSADKFFLVAIPDTTPPVLTLPADIITEAADEDGAIVNFSASANDDRDGNIPVTLIPASGSTFPLGTTTVTATATDAAGNKTTGSFTVTVRDTTPPILIPPDNVTLEATGPSGAVATFTGDAIDTVDGTVPVVFSIPSGSTFPLGTTTVMATATDASGNKATKAFTVTVRDTIPPVLTLPPSLTLEATGPGGAIALFAATATDIVDGTVPVVFSVPSGIIFPLGTTIVTATATDAAGNKASGAFTITVRDTIPPVLALPAGLVLEATGPAGAVATFTASASDIVDGAVPVTFNIASGSTFPLGTTTVMATAADAAGNMTAGSFTVTVRDTTPPILTLPANLVLEATGPAGAIATFTASASDIVDGIVPVTLSLPSGSIFPLGTTTVTATTTDAAGNRTTGAFTITVRDTTPPLIKSLRPSIKTLWPPNHQMVPVRIFADVHDLVDPRPVTRIIFVTSNEPVMDRHDDHDSRHDHDDRDGRRDRDDGPDWKITGDLTLLLRAERSDSGHGRIYTITVESRDASGNASTKTVTVDVPKRWDNN
ncbi:MAG TPA: HYR domain-containing protein [Opitutaceae bacterium]|jgi:hypothetical protein|nr:HYR domain-containing protein [Opitutaceae bacterium]